MKKLIFTLLVLMTLPCSGKVIKVLAIGNSFSEDAVEQYLYELAAAQGDSLAAAQGDSLIIGNAYIGGCSLEMHLDNLKTSRRSYAYRKVVGGVKTEEKKVSLQRIILDEPWDIITLQQASLLSGIADSYKNLPTLHGTSAVTGTELDCIVNQYNGIFTNPFLAWGRYRKGDTLNRDGYHLSYTLGRYTAACTWCEMLTGRIVDGNKYWPSTIKMDDAKLCQQEAHEAIFMQQIRQYATF